jgi:hypothetical protein
MDGKGEGMGGRNAGHCIGVVLTLRRRKKKEKKKRKKRKEEEGGSWIELNFVR